jgi:PhnB protein
MALINPYLTFNGTCEEAFNFYKTVFGGEFKELSRFKEMPASDVYKIPEGAGDKIMHMSLPIGNETILMGSDANPMMGEVHTGQNISLSVDTKSKDEADRIFQGLAKGGKITMPIANTFWGSYFGMLIDKYQNIWMVSYYSPK